MVDTGSWVPEDRRDRFGACFTVDPASRRRAVYDPAGAQSASPWPGATSG